ncbi:MAG TPA: PAS domain-containing sensor histidine kinase [Candidatus Binataceae bacterium]
MKQSSTTGPRKAKAPGKSKSQGKAAAAKSPARTRSRAAKPLAPLAELQALRRRLAAAEDLAHSILDQAVEAIIVCDPQGRIVRANQSAIELCGDSPLSRPFSEAFVLSPVGENAGGDKGWPIRECCANGQTLRGVNAELARPGMPPLEVLTNARPLSSPSGELLGAIIALTDVALTDVNQRARVERTQHFLMEISGALNQSLNVDEKLTIIARGIVPEFADWCVVDVIEEPGLRRVEAVNAQHGGDGITVEIREIEKDNADRLQLLREAKSQLISDLGEAESPAALNGVSRIGARSVMFAPLRARGEVLGAITMATTDSGRRYYIQDLLFAEELARRASHAIDNARLYSEARQAVRVRDEFMSIASHEMRSPLAALTLQLGNLLRMLPSAPLEALELKVQKATSQTHRMAKLIDQLLDVSRISSGHMVLEVAACDLSETAREATERFVDEAARTGSALTLRIEPNVRGLWDGFRLEQVVTNLVSNAIKYGGGNPVEVIVENNSGGARLVVRDHGIGIAEGEMHRVFDRFARSAPARGYGGLGLGLFIANQIVLAHGGTIRVESALGMGSTFIVELPREVPASAVLNPQPLGR